MKMPSVRKSAFLAACLGSALALMHCQGEQMAGSSVTTGNPTEIQVSFTGENGEVALSGRVEVYGATQIPIAGFNPEPLARFDVSGQKAFSLDTADFASIPDSLWPVGSLENDSLAHFNLVVTGDGQGAIVRDLTLNTKSRIFALGSASSVALKKEKVEDVLRVEASLGVLSEHLAFIDPENMPANHLNYLFLKGTGFAARENDGTFRFPTLPEGNHIVSYLSLPDPQFVEGGQDGDSVYVINLDRSISSGERDTLSYSDIDFGLDLPDLYKNKK